MLMALRGPSQESLPLGFLPYIISRDAGLKLCSYIKRILNYGRLASLVRAIALNDGLTKAPGKKSFFQMECRGKDDFLLQPISLKIGSYALPTLQVMTTGPFQCQEIAIYTDVYTYVGIWV